MTVRVCVTAGAVSLVGVFVCTPLLHPDPFEHFLPEILDGFGGGGEEWIGVVPAEFVQELSAQQGTAFLAGVHRKFGEVKTMAREERWAFHTDHARRGWERHVFLKPELNVGLWSVTVATGYQAGRLNGWGVSTTYVWFLAWSAISKTIWVS